eukprot:SAG25_NODE_8900_length_398_cov_0.672241_1_plen_25_part_10
MTGWAALAQEWMLTPDKVRHYLLIA